MPAVNGSMLYNLVECPHRVSLDQFEDPGKRDEVSPFVQLLWERGNLYEKETIAAWGSPFTDLKTEDVGDRARLTLDAMQRRDVLIYGGRIEVGDQVGEPDLLRLDGQGYVPIDIKSGSGEEGDEDDTKPKAHYAVQLGLYIDVLEQTGLSAGRYGFIYDVHGEEVRYDFSVPYGKRQPRTLWQDYQEALTECRQILSRAVETTPALASVCKNCYWYSSCLERLVTANDLTLLPELGRSRRDVLMGRFPTVRDLAQVDPRVYIKGSKTEFPGIGPDSLIKFQARAALTCAANPQPYLKQVVALPNHDTELFFDIEVDPMRDFCYLHGFVVRRRGDSAAEQYTAFFADAVTPELEKQVFQQALDFIRGHQPCSVFYYSHYERTIWRKLAEKYPDVCSVDEIEQLFAADGFLDLYGKVTRPHTEWPTRDYSIKTLAKYLGFAWRDTHPSGAASIEWFDRWVKEGDPAVKNRILAYNEDDCRATRHLLDGIKALPVR